MIHPQKVDKQIPELRDVAT